MQDIFIIKQEEIRTIQDGDCPVDLMGEISKKEEGPIAFFLTKMALFSMFEFPATKTVSWKEKEVFIQWDGCDDYMNLLNCKNGWFMVVYAKTEEIIYNVRPGEVTAFYIDVA